MYKFALTAAAITLVLGTACAQASPHCQGPISAEVNTHQALTLAHDGATPARVARSYAQAFAVARQEAIAAWARKVYAQCPHMAASWQRAAARQVEECDRAMGGRFTVCVRAVPAPKWFGWRPLWSAQRG